MLEVLPWHQELCLTHWCSKVSTFPVILFALFAEDHLSLTDRFQFKSTEAYIFLAWILSSVIHILYAFIWDKYMDWGLFQCKNLLRKQLIYKWKILLLLFFAIVENLVLRFAWSTEQFVLHTVSLTWNTMLICVELLYEQGYHLVGSVKMKIKKHCHEISPLTNILL